MTPTPAQQQRAAQINELASVIARVLNGSHELDKTVERSFSDSAQVIVSQHSENSVYLQIGDIDTDKVLASFVLNLI